MSILFEDCVTTSFASYNGSNNGCGGSLGCGDGLIVSGVFTPGQITVNRFRAVRNGGSGISIGKAVTTDDADSAVATLLIRDTVLETNNPDEHEWRGVQDSEIHLLVLPPSFDPNITKFGGVTLDNVSVVKDLRTTNNQSSWLTTVGAGSVSGIKGSVEVHSAIGCPLVAPSFGAGAMDIDLTVVCHLLKTDDEAPASNFVRVL